MAPTALESARARAARAVNVDVVRRTYLAIEDLFRDRPGALDGAFHDRFDERFELLLPASYPEGARVLRGRDGMRRWVSTTKEVWDEWRFEPERLIPAGDQVVALVRVVARGALSGVPLVRETAHLWTLENGRVTRCEVYLDRTEALEAAGPRSRQWSRWCVRCGRLRCASTSAPGGRWRWWWRARSRSLEGCSAWVRSAAIWWC